MKSGLLILKEVRSGFQEKVVKEIVAVMEKGENLQLVGLPGSGKTKMAVVALGGKGTEEYDFVYVDLNLMAERTVRAFWLLMVEVLRRKEKGKDVIDLVAEVKGEMEEREQQRRNVVLVFDNFENLIEKEFEMVFKVLRSIYEKNRAVLNFIFILEREVKIEETGEIKNRFFRLLRENVIWVSCLGEEDGLWWIRLCSKQLGMKLEKDEEQEIYRLSGGFMRTIKRLVEGRAKGISLDKMYRDPTVDVHLLYHLEELWDYLGKERETLKKLVLGEEVSNGKDLANLRNMGVIDKKRKARMELFWQFVREKMGREGGETVKGEIKLGRVLTRGEGRVVNYLLGKKGELVDKDDLIEVIWGKEAVGISNHALDQLVCRVRKKLVDSQPKVRIKTVFGRGYRLEVEI